jgi:hypothetical protein
MTVVPQKPHYFEDRPLEELFAELEEIIVDCRKLARKMDEGEGVVVRSIELRKQLMVNIHYSYSLRQEIVRRRKLDQAKRRAEGS